ncbi:hypothetical protein C922_03732 [Plasmodium inui San Antonio 1]|uniref:Uncharacterized protein n=1 Tax=Plasmodium inui San Antonio 1 TaxID=1237626 RepID=W7A9D4_9APIC|nr:hypothetical protein C922_03732 [Plasmodium inui San Antonio 1]EUD65749.1 hypothetical protein C922_03732 [Plasmodium inui San Antonio 1]
MSRPRARARRQRSRDSSRREISRFYEKYGSTEGGNLTSIQSNIMKDEESKAQGAVRCRGKTSGQVDKEEQVLRVKSWDRMKRSLANESKTIVTKSRRRGNGKVCKNKIRGMKKKHGEIGG